MALVRSTALAGVAGLALTLAACENSQPSQAVAPQQGDVTVTAGADGVQSVVIDANDEFRFLPATVRVHVGKVRITLRNVGSTPHTLTFDTLTAQSGAAQSGAAQSGAAQPGKVAVPLTRGRAEQLVEFTVNTPGRYGFVCTIHESLNQTGTLVVSP